MALYYRASRKELLEIRNKIFIERGLLALYKNGFIGSPFSTSLFGRNNLKDFTYMLCRLSPGSSLETITVHISRGDRWIKIFLNIFKLHPRLGSLKALNNLDGLQYVLPPNSVSKMRLRIDDTKDMPLFRMLFGKEHKLGSFYTKNGLKYRSIELGDLINKDMTDIDRFVKRWHEIHIPFTTNWEGRVVDK